MKPLTVEDCNRIRLPDVKPQQVFVHEHGPDGSIILTPAGSAKRSPNKVRFEKRGGRTVGVIEWPNFNEVALKRAVAEFP